MLKERDYMKWVSFCKEKKILGSVEFDGLVIETDEENPKAVAYIPKVLSGVVPAPGYRVRLDKTMDYFSAYGLAELMAPEYLNTFEASVQGDSSSTP